MSDESGERRLRNQQEGSAGYIERAGTFRRGRESILRTLRLPGVLQPPGDAEGRAGAIRPVFANGQRRIDGSVRVPSDRQPRSRSARQDTPSPITATQPSLSGQFSGWPAALRRFTLSPGNICSRFQTRHAAVEAHRPDQEQARTSNSRRRLTGGMASSWVSEAAFTLNNRRRSQAAHLPTDASCTGAACNNSAVVCAATYGCRFIHPPKFSGIVGAQRLMAPGAGQRWLGWPPACARLDSDSV